MPPSPPDDAAPLRPLLQTLEDAWCAGDAQRFASVFGDDADFVDVLGRISRGRAAIERLHLRNFDTIHRNSRLTLELLRTRALSATMLLAQVRGQVDVPEGPMAGRTIGIQTWLVERSGSHWQITAFHNTHRREIEGVPPLP